MCSHGAAHRRPERAAIAPITRRVRAERTDKKRIRRISPITGMSFYIVMETSLKQKIFLSRLDQIAEELPPQRPPMKFSFSPSGIPEVIGDWRADLKARFRRPARPPCRRSPPNEIA